jgi:hypothetical protein
VVGLVVYDAEGAVELFEEDNTGEVVRQGYRAEARKGVYWFY